MDEIIKTCEPKKLCRNCKETLYKESLEVYTNESGRELYQIVWVCPNGCDCFNTKDCKGAVESYKRWLKTKIQKEIDFEDKKQTFQRDHAYQAGLNRIFAILTSED